MKPGPIFAIILFLTLGAAGAVTSGNTHPTPTFAVVSVVDEDWSAISGKALGANILGVVEIGAPSVIYATGGMDPRGKDLVPTGQAFDFTDPNGASWTVREYTFDVNYAYGTEVGATHHDATIGDYNFVLVVNAAKLGGKATLFTQ